MTKGILQNSTIGTMGRWGNQVHQYVALRVLAKRNECEYQCRNWVGQELFGFNDPAINGRLTTLSEKDFHGKDDAIIPQMPSVRNYDLRGYFQYHTEFWIPDREFILSLFDRPRNISNSLSSALAILHVKAPVLGIHVRETDYGRGTFYRTPHEWYEELLDRVAGNYRTIFVATENPDFLDRISKYGPVTATSLGVEAATAPDGYNYLPHERRVSDPRQLDFFTDWLLLKHCDAIAMPNSTFSFTAAWLSRTCKRAWRSDPDTRRFDPIDPWDAMPLRHIKQEDYAHVPGLWVRDSPYWR